jgi:hypothetical protein
MSSKIKRLFLRHYLTLSAFLLGLALTFFIGGFVALGLNNNPSATLNFYQAAFFGFSSAIISFVGADIARKQNDR